MFKPSFPRSPVCGKLRRRKTLPLFRIIKAFRISRNLTDMFSRKDICPVAIRNLITRSPFEVMGKGFWTHAFPFGNCISLTLP